MTGISDGFLLTIAQIAATLIGLLLVGALFFAETGLRQLGRSAPAAASYFSSGTLFVLSLYFLVLAMALALVVVDLPWARLLFVLLTFEVAAALVMFTLRARSLSRAQPTLLHPISPWLPWPAAVIGLAVPWLAGGLAPDAGAFVAALLVLGSLAFVATAGLVLSTFQLVRLPENAEPEPEPARETSPATEPSGG